MLCQLSYFRLIKYVLSSCPRRERYSLRRKPAGCSKSIGRRTFTSELLTRIELVTSSLPRKCSTTELQQLFNGHKGKENFYTHNLPIHIFMQKFL